MKQSIPVSLFLLLLCTSMSAQNTHADSTSISETKFRITSLIIPMGLISYGIIGMENYTIKDINVSTKNEIAEHIDEKRTIDDFIQLYGTVTVYGLNIVGFKGKNNFKDRTILLGTSFALMATSVLSLKSITNVQRPDGSADNSFPSGHTATAFVGAEFLYQEYKAHPLLWISGYAFATGTGLFRVYNDRHWITDVVAGAGFGMLSTKLAYWIYPKVKDKLFNAKKEHSSQVLIYPQSNGNQTLLAISITF